MITKIFSWILKHKIITIFIILIIVNGGYFGYKKFFSNNNISQYVLSQVRKGNISVAVNGSGYVSAVDQVDIKSKVGGDVIGVYVKAGQQVNQGDLLVKIDTQDAEHAVLDAETFLESAKLDLQKLLKPPDELELKQAENALEQAKESKQKAEDDLKKAYEDGFNFVSNAFLDLPGIMTGLEDILFKKTIDLQQDNITWYLNQTSYLTGEREKAKKYFDDVYDYYNRARDAYNRNFDFYKSTSRNSDRATIESLILETYNTTQLIAEAVKTVSNFIDFVQDSMKQRDIPIPLIVTIHQSNLANYTLKLNSHLINLLSIKRTIEDSKNALVNSKRLIEERSLALDKLKKGPDELDIKTKQLLIQQKENALISAKQNLEDHYIRPPFSGTIGKVNVKKGDSISSGTVIATLISKQKIAEISLNEIDIANVKVGQKAVLTFDALPGITLNGEVYEVDLVGTVSQGVVSYTVKIGFSTDDNRIKPGMSVSADIITDTKQNVLIVPNSAIKTMGNRKYVEVPDERENLNLQENRFVNLKYPPKIVFVKTGLSDDKNTEILEGLKEGDLVILRKISGNNNSNQSSQNQQQGLFQRFIPQPRQFIRSPGQR
jgi:HlyD family secretion protein